MRTLAATLAHEGSPCAGIQVESLIEDAIGQGPVGMPRQALRISSLVSHALPDAQRRLTVATEMLRASAASSMDNPPKMRSDTTSAATASKVSSSLSNASTSSASYGVSLDPKFSSLKV